MTDRIEYYFNKKWREMSPDDRKRLMNFFDINNLIEITQPRVYEMKFNNDIENRDEFSELFVLRDEHGHGAKFRYICTRCDKRFYTVLTLVYHQLIEHEENIYGDTNE